MPTVNSPSYLVKDPYSYYFRIKVPKDLLHTITRKELKFFKEGDAEKRWNLKTRDEVKASMHVLIDYFGEPHLPKTEERKNILPSTSELLQ